MAIFYFSARGRGKGARGDREGGFGSLLKIPGAGGGSPKGGGEGPGGCLRRIWGGGRAKFFFFSGRNVSQVMCFIADTDTDNNHFGIYFSLQMQF